MKVYVTELEKVKEITLIGLDGKDCAEQFILNNIGIDAYGSGFEKINDIVRAKISHKTDVSDVNYAMSWEMYTDVVSILEITQQAYDKTKEEMITSKWSASDMIAFVVSKGKTANDTRRYFCLETEE